MYQAGFFIIVSQCFHGCRKFLTQKVCPVRYYNIVTNKRKPMLVLFSKMFKKKTLYDQNMLFVYAGIAQSCNGPHWRWVGYSRELPGQA